MSEMKIPNVALAYQESEALGASPVGVVVLLYNRLVQDIHDAVAAMKASRVEDRSAHVNHALLILQQLQGRLDFADGGESARQLHAFYSHSRAKLLEAQIRQSPELMIAQARALLQVRDAWVQVEQTSAPHANPVTSSAPDAPSAGISALNLGA
jgi:flagellar protein FliS